MNKVERLRGQLRNMREQGQAIARNTLHAGETLVVGSTLAFAEGRLSDETGEWGYRGVPYAYMGAGVLFLTGLFAGERYGADLFAMGSGAVGSHLFRSMYETGLESKTSTTGRKQLRSKVGMGNQLGQNIRQNVGTNMGQQQPQPVRQNYGTAFDGLGGR